MATQKKIDTVQTLTDKLGKAKSVVFADYTGLTHKQLEHLRKDVKKLDSEFVVTKNKLLERSLGENAASLKPVLRENTAMLLNYADEVGALKTLLKFFKSANLGKTKGGMLGMTILSQADVTTLASLPGKQELIGRLAGQLMAPLSGLHYALSWNINKLVWALNAIKVKKS